MPSMEEAAVAMTNRSLRNIRNELEYLTESSIITPQQLETFLSQLPAQTPIHPPVAAIPVVAAVPVVATPSVDPTANEKHGFYATPSPTPGSTAPPAYAAAMPLGVATALYAYNSEDVGDVVLQPNDRVAILEYVNQDWWKGRNERTGLEGIFPRAYVKVLDEKAVPTPANGYGNAPMAVAQGESAGDAAKPSKVNEQGKKFGKKLGNATIFGAGATIGSNLVNGIF